MNAHTKALKIATEIDKPENADMIARQLLAKSFDANRQAIALANVPDYVIADFEAMTVGERRYKHEVASMQAIRHDILARRPNHPSADYHRDCAANARRTTEALKAVGL